ncbi:YxeA family protein [Aquibacillus rhizosphaerae]|uniref:YxeA family protein n=1 Tax=Aquibacillus rhizosphaerae TaxID=3051431 RepID=A0ABT7L211_9BACI|nr:YxeA family protein [Aquibacillus sp. LR5S19]MDL4839873.1 YxeA family protein [Aquibacillus sp. LR5S19]
MNKKVRNIVIAVVVIFAGFFVIVPEGERARINPFIELGNVYVQVNEEPVVDEGRYYYDLTGYHEDGKKTELAFSAIKDLKENAFLKITAKGAFVKGYEEVQAEALPEDVKAKFDK